MDLIPNLPCSVVSGANDLGGLVVVSAMPCVAAAHAFLFQNGVVVDLGTLPGGSISEALGINNRGQVVGEASTASGNTHAFLLENGVMVDLGTLPGGTSSFATGINHRGQEHGYSHTPNAQTH